MEDDDLDRLELDLRAVADRLGGERSWEALRPRVRRAARRPYRALAYTLTLGAVMLVAGFWAPSAWMAAAGLALAVVPDRVRAARARRRELERIGEGELLALVRREILAQHAEHVLKAFLSVALAAVFLLTAAFAPRALPGLIVAVVLLARAAMHLLWHLPRASRELSALGRDDAAPEGGGA